jgi:hypothetical protein
MTPTKAIAKWFDHNTLINKVYMKIVSSSVYKFSQTKFMTIDKFK